MSECLSLFTHKYSAYVGTEVKVLLLIKTVYTEEVKEAPGTATVAFTYVYK